MTLFCVCSRSLTFEIPVKVAAIFGVVVSLVLLESLRSQRSHGGAAAVQGPNKNKLVAPTAHTAFATVKSVKKKTATPPSSIIKSRIFKAEILKSQHTSGKQSQ
jgi:hypothetical protein